VDYEFSKYDVNALVTALEERIAILTPLSHRTRTLASALDPEIKRLRKLIRIVVDCRGLTARNLPYDPDDDKGHGNVA
jgi:hypothetical protein